MRIAVNLVRDHVRNRRVQFRARLRMGSGPPLQRHKALDVTGQSPEKAAILRQQVSAIWQYADALPERQKTVFLLRFVEDMDILEIAATTGLKEGTVKTRLFRALRTVRAALRGSE